MASSSNNFSYGFPTPGPQNPTGTHVMDQTFFLSEDQWREAREQEQFDYIVIGSGFCALAFASRILEKDPRARLLLLERGPFFLPEHCQALPLPFQHVIGGFSETFPWTLSATTAESEPPRYVKWQHGMVPFFGGRSTTWSGWCPEPTDEELEAWPREVVAAAREYMPQAKALLNVVSSDRIGNCRNDAVFGNLQRALFDFLDERIPALDAVITRAIYAPLAVRDPHEQGLDFIKFSTVGPLLALVGKYPGQLKIATNCTVSRILHHGSTATALETSRGHVRVHTSSKLILAMGSVPPATLVLNSFPSLPNVGNRFTAHFVTSIVARIPRASCTFADSLDKEKLELGAIYIAGVDPKNKSAQFHIQLTALHDPNPDRNAEVAFRYMPDVVATASTEQLKTSRGKYVVLVCAVLGELEHKNPDSWLKRGGDNNGVVVEDPTMNVVLQVRETENDLQLWDAMDETTFQVLEKGLASAFSVEGGLQYWHGETNDWRATRPSRDSIRVPGLVHEGSTMHIGGDIDPEAVVDLDYRLKGVTNVWVTGGALWPKSGSWNPTLTMVALTQHLADNFLA